MSQQQIYLMKNDMGLYKIGISKHPEKRAREVSTASGVPTQVVDLWESYNAYLTEQRLHNIFKDKRKSGEWFKFAKRDLKLVGKYISDFDSLIPHQSDLSCDCEFFKPPCQGIRASLTKSFIADTIDEYIKIRDFQYKVLQTEFANREGYFSLINELKMEGYYVPYVWSAGAECCGFSSDNLYKPTFSYFQREYPICKPGDKAKLDILYTKSYLEDLSSTKLHLEKQLDREIEILKSLEK